MAHIRTSFQNQTATLDSELQQALEVIQVLETELDSKYREFAKAQKVIATLTKEHARHEALLEESVRREQETSERVERYLGQFNTAFALVGRVRDSEEHTAADSDAKDNKSD